MGAFDELRFGAQRTLNLREQLPSAAEAVKRADMWLREQQVKGSKEVLIITGRGRQSLGGVGVIRNAVENLLFSLRRRGVVSAHHEHNPGAFVATLAPLRRLLEAPPRRRDARLPRAIAPIHGLTPQTLTLLRDLAERSLESLGITPDDSRVEDEMHRQLGAMASALPRGASLDQDLQAALRAVIAEYD